MGESTQSTRLSNLCFQPLCEEGRPRAQHGPPLSTSLDHASHNDEVWVWNTGEDLITAVKSEHADQQAFLISYRPSRLRPEVL